MKPAMTKLVLASNNTGKITELSELLAPLNITIIAQSELGVTDIDETGTTFVENAILKAKHAAKISGLPALADDSGLVVPALGGEPGIYSARYADKPKNDAKNNEKLLKNLREKSNRQAAFVCVMALCYSDTHPLPLIAQGLWQGAIAQTADGDGGFGYDPIFYVPTHKMTAAKLQQAEKNQISHRGQALQALLAQLSSNKSG